MSYLHYGAHPQKRKWTGLNSTWLHSLENYWWVFQGLSNALLLRYFQNIPSYLGFHPYNKMDISKTLCKYHSSIKSNNINACETVKGKCLWLPPLPRLHTLTYDWGGYTQEASSSKSWATPSKDLWNYDYSICPDLANSLLQMCINYSLQTWWFKTFKTYLLTSNICREIQVESQELHRKHKSLYPKELMNIFILMVHPSFCNLGWMKLITHQVAVILPCTWSSIFSLKVRTPGSLW